ncbi:YybS family protein [Cytobacillus sp. S13-E01]|uniref:YybS family protein n=1 Tax=Cytobacillus sp. S13-E01 TaxID=3031326 RepID=UPI0023D8BC53|nr:YybS family protein [Cytobacillus sp. S13-E01]MDF0728506.1 YybS family protein [Cytobacillus sp. S13-E01]
MEKTKQLTEGAILLALYSILLLLFLYVPLVGIIVLFVLPLPFIIYTIRNGINNTVVLFIAALLLTIILGSFAALPLTFMFGSSGIVLGYLIRSRKSRYGILLGGTLVYIINIVILYVIAVTLMNINVMDLALTTTRETMDTSSDFLKSIGQQGNETALQQFEEALKVIPYLLPSTFLMLAFILAFFTQLASIPFLKRLKIDVEAWPPFRDLMLPKSILWYYLIVMVLMFLQFEVGTFGYTAIINLFYILQLLMMIQGVSFIFYFCYQKGIVKGIPIAITIVSLILPFLLYIIRILGIIDLGFQIREKIQLKK